MTKSELLDKANGLPLLPGVYLMMDKSGKVIYVGKAKKLKNRVSQYFQENAGHNEKTRRMVSRVDHFETIIVNSEFEALVLENSLIKRHNPKYNILLKDDKGYPFIRLGRERYPRFGLAAKHENDGARYFGPYGSRGETRNALNALLSALKLPTCNRKFPRDIGKERPCLNYHMGRCDGFCRPEMTEEVYNNRITQAVRILEGKSKELTREFTESMEREAENLNFERAARIRDKIQSLKALSKKQSVIAGLCTDTDIWGLYLGEGIGCYAVLHIEDGNLTGRETEYFKTPLDESDADLLPTLAARYYLSKSVLPREILLPLDIDYNINNNAPDTDANGAAEDQNVSGMDENIHNNVNHAWLNGWEGDSLCASMSEALSKRAGRKVWVHVPKRGEKAELCAMARRNARQEAERVVSESERESYTIKSLQNILNLPRAPERLESYDISNTGGHDIVASMVVYSGVKPLKSAYRRFHIKDLKENHPDDYASMREVLRRRLRRAKDGDEKFLPLPDVFLIDGGAAHAKIALEVTREFDYHIPVFGMVKDDRHRTRALMTPDGEELGIVRNQAVFAFIGRIQEETHRFAITFHRESHAKSAVKSKLDGIPGIGPKRQAALREYFKSVKAIENANLDELCKILPRPAAESVWKRFHPDAGESNNA